jgi:hypothetical protein
MYITWHGDRLIKIVQTLYLVFLLNASPVCQIHSKNIINEKMYQIINKSDINDIKVQWYQ